MKSRPMQDIDPGDLAEAVPDPKLRAIVLEALRSPDPVEHLRRAAGTESTLLVRFLGCVLDIAEKA